MSWWRSCDMEISITSFKLEPDIVFLVLNNLFVEISLFHKFSVFLNLWASRSSTFSHFWSWPIEHWLSILWDPQQVFELFKIFPLYSINNCLCSSGIFVFVFDVFNSYHCYVTSQIIYFRSSRLAFHISNAYYHHFS